MTPEARATMLINKYHGKKVTDSGLREAITKAIKVHGEQEYKRGFSTLMEGLKECIKQYDENISGELRINGSTR